MAIDLWKLILASLAFALTVAVPLIGWVMRLINTISKELTKHDLQIEHVKKELNTHNLRIVKREDEIVVIAKELTDVRKEMHEMRQEFTVKLNDLQTAILNRLNETLPRQQHD